MNFGVIKYITYIVIIIGLIVGRLKEITQQYIKTINEYIDGFLLPLENRPQLIRKDESKRIEIKQTVSKFKIGMCIAATLSIFGMLLTLKVLILPHIINNKVVAVLLIILLFAMMTFEKRKKKNNVKKKNDKIEIDENVLGGIKEDIVKMCKKLKISNVKIGLLECSGAIKIETGIDENQIPHIGVSYSFLQTLYTRDGAKDILLYIIGHKLAHVYYDDFNNIAKRVKKSYFIYFVGMMIIICIALFIEDAFVQNIGLVLLLIHCFIFNVICDKRYWHQIAELKADRLSVQIYNGEKTFLIDFWKEYDKNKDSKRKKENAIYEYYKKYIKIESHPSMTRRMELLEKRNKWHRWEYFEHMLLICKWRITNKGWNGHVK